MSLNNVFITKPAATLLQVALDKADKCSNASDARDVLRIAIEKHIATLTAITSMSAFKIYMSGERFEDVAIRANKR